MNTAKILDFHIILGAIFAAFAWKYGDWRNWKRYYPTILYMIMGDYLYGILCCNYPLWRPESPLLKETFSDIFISLTLFPSGILIIIPHMPATLPGRIAYFSAWIGAYSLLEFVANHIGYFSYHNGWTIWTSVLFYCVMLPLLYLHYKKPLIAFALLFFFAGVGLLLFQVPIRLIK